MSEGAVEGKGVGGWNAVLRPSVLDRAEQVVIVILFCLLAYRVLGSENPLALLLLLSEAAVAFFVVIRRPTTAISVRIGDWPVRNAARPAVQEFCPYQSVQTIPSRPMGSGWLRSAPRKPIVVSSS